MTQEHMPYYTNDEIVAEMRAINDKWVRERTCRRTVESGACICSECGGALPHWFVFNYCPKCGAKVVE